MIIKKIYFSGNTYKQNEKEFIRMLNTFDISWYKPAEKMYVNNKQIKLLSGIFLSKDQNKKIFAFFEGNEKPATMIIKISGGGGNFLIDINSFCHSAGCIIEDKDEKYLNNILSRLKEFGDIKVENIGSIENVKNNKRLADFDISTLVSRRIVRSIMRRYVLSYGKYFLDRGISIKVVLSFKKRFFEEDVGWALENGWIINCKNVGR